MRSMMIIIWSNIKKRKLQTFLVFLTILLSIVLFGTSLGILQNQHDPFHHMFESQKGSHIVLDVDHRYTDLDEMVSWWKNQEEIVDVINYPYMMISDTIMHNNIEKSIGSVMMTERVIYDYQTDLLFFVEGTKKDYPDDDEIFVPTGYAYNWNIRLNDELIFSFNGSIKAFTVAAIVVDPQYSATLTSPSRLWIKEGTLNAFYSEEELHQSLVAIRFNDYSNYESVMLRYEDDFGHPFFGFIYNYDFIIYMYTFIESIIAMIMLVFSFILLIISIVVIIFTISNGIRSDLKQIGIYKTIGFNKNHIYSIYIIHYLFLLIIALPFGLGISFLLTKLVLKQYAQSVGLHVMTLNYFSIITITTLLTISLITISAWLSSRKAANIKPIETIRYAIDQTVQKKSNISLSKIKFMNVSLIIAIKGILSNLKHSIFILLSCIVLSFVFAFAANLYYSVLKMSDNMAMWGFDSSEVFVTIDNQTALNESETLMNILSSHPDVFSVSRHGVMADASIAKQNNISSTTALGFVYGGVWDDIGLANIEGYNPINLNDVSISYLTAQKYNKKVGDTIIVYIAGIEKTMNITGIYQSLNAGGWGFRVKAETVLEINPEYDLPRYLVKLNHLNHTNNFIEEFNSLYKDVYTARSVKDSGDINIDQIVSLMSVISMTLSVIFAFISIIIVFNFMMMFILDHYREFGIYKAIGMDEKTLRNSIRIKISILSVIGGLVGILLALDLTPVIISVFLKNMGLAKFPFMVNMAMTILVFSFSIAIQLIAANVASRKLRNVDLRELIME